MTDVETPPADEADETVEPSTSEPESGSEAPTAGKRRWRIDRRLETPWYLEVASVFAGLAAAVLVTSLLIMAAGSEVLASYGALYRGAFGSGNSAIETLVQATPLIFTGLAAAFAFRAKVWNIGGEGQFFAGAMGAYLASTFFNEGFPRLPLIITILVFAALFGALWAGLAAWLRTRFDVNEIITTVMLNFVIFNILSFLLNGWWQDPASFYAQTGRMSPDVALPRMFDGSRLHVGFLLALVMAGVVWFVLNRTSFGYEVRSIGANPRVASYGGVISGRIIMATMLISGGIAGLAGASELIGVQLRLQSGISANFGFTGIIIALVARLKPAGVVVAAIAAGALTNGATSMQLSTGVPAALVDVITGLTLVFVLVAAVVVNYQVRRVGTDG